VVVRAASGFDYLALSESKFAKVEARMDTRSPLNQCIALALAGILFLEPIVAAAAGLAVDATAAGNTQLGQAGNGVPVVDIATPNGSGLSHNKFSDYNVGPQGLILNNATGKTQATQLGGLILGNPNLHGQAASTILNEVTGGNRSQLAGYTEVAGQAARVIVANPHGITCNGCGFLNTPRASLTTGKPVLEGGRLDRFQVDGGDIAVEGSGLNASNLDQFDLITRSAKLNAELQAQRLNLIAGRNDVDANSLAATPRADDGSARPGLAIDSSALGGMYAGAIRLVGTEAGVGVKLAGDLAASAGDIRIDASGQLTLAQTAASGNLQVTAQSAELTGKAYAGGSANVVTLGDLSVQQSLAAQDAVRLASGGQMNNQGVIEAGVTPDNRRTASGDLRVSAREVRNRGSLVASRSLEVSANQTLDNQGGTLSAQGNAQVAAGKLDNRQGRILGQGELALAAGELDNRQGLVTSAGTLEARLGQLDNRGGEVSSRATATLHAGNVDNRTGKLIGEQALQLSTSAAVNNQGGTLSPHDAPPSWTLGGAKVDSAQREQAIPGEPSRPLVVPDAPATQPGVPGQVARVQGVPDHPSPPGTHKYLVETNPALTDLRQFLGSDYLLGRLGYDPDQAQKRLGDGLYEQRLVREAIAARTGQRFLAGLNSDEAMFRYLMDNAIASQQALNLSVGVGLTAAQVAALTHDIVWLEEHEVNGEKVLVPVLYLAQAKGRLAPNGALIQGQDVALITGGELTNQGTLRATQNLKASAREIGNSGLIEAGQRLDLLATDSIRNAQGGIIAGRDVSAIALSGDLINGRSVSTLQHGGTSLRQTDSVLNAAARIEAADSLSLAAGRDLQNLGSHLGAGGNASLSAGRDLLLGAATEIDQSEGRGKKSRWRETTVTQHGSEVQVGGDLKVEAGRDLAVVASQVSAGRDLDLAAGRDLDIAAAANESHSEFHAKGGGKKLDIQQDQVRQQSSVLEAGGDFTAIAGRGLTVTASQVKAGDEAYLYAGNDLSLLAAEDSDYSLYDKKKKGSFGSKKSQRDEVTDVHNVGSSINTGGDLTLVSEGDQRYQKAKLESGADLTLNSGGAISFEAVKDLHQESHEKSKSDLAWTSAKGKGQTDETLRQSELLAQGEIAIRAVDGLKVDLKQIDQQSVSQTIDAMVQADPSLAWLKQMEQRGDVDWRRVKEVHDSFQYSHSGLGGGAQLAIAIVMAAVVGPAAGAAAGGGTTGAVAGAAAATAATKATVSTINNQGDLGAALKDVTSKDSLKDYLVAATTAGMTAGLFDKLFGTETNSFTDKVSKVDLSTLDGVGKFAGNQLAQSGTAAALNKLMGRDPSFKDALQSALYNTLAAAAFNAVGDYTQDKWVDGSPQKVAIHAMVGGLLSSATGGDFKTGALAAGANEALVVQLDAVVKSNPALLTMSSQLVGLVAAAAVDGDVEKGAWVAQNATQYNFLGHQELDELEQEARACQARGNCHEVQEKFRALSVANDDDLRAMCGSNPALCSQFYGDLLHDRNSLQERLARMFFDDSIPSLFKGELHRYQLQNTSAITALTQTGVRLEQESKGASPETASWRADVVAAMGGLFGGKRGGGVKGQYQPNSGSVGNMGEFLSQQGFGSQIRASARKTTKQYQGQSVYQASSNIGENIRKGDQFYLDAQHKNHLEVFDGKGRFRYVLNLDGSVNEAKTQAAAGRKMK
jgi:filamentous hemagglutinin family protein